MPALFSSHSSALRMLPQALPLGHMVANHLRADQVNAVYKFWLPDGFMAWYAAESDGHGTYFGVQPQHVTELRHFTRDDIEDTGGLLGLTTDMDAGYLPQVLNRPLRYWV